MKQLKFFALTCMVLLVVSCDSPENVNDSENSSETNFRVTLFDRQGKVSYVLLGEKTVEEVEQIIQSKKPMMKKLLPLFKMKLVVESGGDKKEWLVEKPNYIKSNTKGDNKIYVIPVENDLFKKLEDLSKNN